MYNTRIVLQRFLLVWSNVLLGIYVVSETSFDFSNPKTYLYCGLLGVLSGLTNGFFILIDIAEDILKTLKDT